MNDVEQYAFRWEQRLSPAALSKQTAKSRPPDFDECYGERRKLSMVIPSELAVLGCGARVNANNWTPHRDDPRYNSVPYEHHYEYQTGRLLVRADIFEHFNQSTRRGIVSAIKWGYPSGKVAGRVWRGLSAALRSDKLVNEIDALRMETGLSASDLISRLNNSTSGIGTATSTKLAYFAGLVAAEGPCLIYDSMVRRAIRVRSDLEFCALRLIIRETPGDLAPAWCVHTYGLYLKGAHAMAKRLHTRGDQIELFLFNGREDAGCLSAVVSNDGGRPCGPG